jgi:hypothetical protein
METARMIQKFLFQKWSLNSFPQEKPLQMPKRHLTLVRGEFSGVCNATKDFSSLAVVTFTWAHSAARQRRRMHLMAEQEHAHITRLCHFQKQLISFLIQRYSFHT